MYLLSVSEPWIVTYNSISPLLVKGLQEGAVTKFCLKKKKDYLNKVSYNNIASYLVS